MQTIGRSGGIRWGGRGRVRVLNGAGEVGEGGGIERIRRLIAAERKKWKAKGKELPVKRAV